MGGPRFLIINHNCKSLAWLGFDVVSVNMRNMTITLIDILCIPQWSGGAWLPTYMCMYVLYYIPVGWVETCKIVVEVRWFGFQGYISFMRVRVCVFPKYHLHIIMWVGWVFEWLAIASSSTTTLSVRGITQHCLISTHIPGNRDDNVQWYHMTSHTHAGLETVGIFRRAAGKSRVGILRGIMEANPG